MPIYTFRDKNTNQEFTEMMSISSKEKYLQENSHIEQVITVPNFADSVSIGVTKPPIDFQRGVLDRIKSSVPGANKNTIEKRWTIPKEV